MSKVQGCSQDFFKGISNTTAWTPLIACLSSHVVSTELFIYAAWVYRDIQFLRTTSSARLSLYTFGCSRTNSPFRFITYLTFNKLDQGNNQIFTIACRAWLSADIQLQYYETAVLDYYQPSEHKSFIDFMLQLSATSKSAIRQILDCEAWTSMICSQKIFMARNCCKCLANYQSNVIVWFFNGWLSFAYTYTSCRAHTDLLFVWSDCENMRSIIMIYCNCFINISNDGFFSLCFLKVMKCHQGNITVGGPLW